MLSGSGRTEYAIGINLGSGGKEHHHSCSIQQHRLICMVSDRHAEYRPSNNFSQVIDL